MRVHNWAFMLCQEQNIKMKKYGETKHGLIRASNHALDIVPVRDLNSKKEKDTVQMNSKRRYHAYK